MVRRVIYTDVGSLIPQIEQLSFADMLEWSFNKKISDQRQDIEDMKSNIQWRFPNGPARDNLKKMVEELKQVLEERDIITGQWQ